MSRRIERVNELIRHELSEMVLHELRDPRLDGLISITRVDVSPDLYNAKVYVSVMSETADQADALKALGAAAGYLHKELVHRLDMRRIPFLTFQLDKSIEEGAAVLAHIDEVLHEDKSRED
ncbi:MAG TPA: 30S ribosome-binding factor RbfA [Dehalococcoidia bacterium]|jgi:ribosome-binding factor A|nr:30S ribosome-binding factor RbfA [Dehalococcoidia bacterium]